MKSLSDRNKGILFLLASAFSFATMSAISTMVGDISAMQKMFFRSTIVAIVTAIVMKSKGQSFRIRRDCLKEHFFRSLFGMLGVVGNYYAVTHMLLSDANMIMEMSPFFVILFCALILGEKADSKQYAFVILALIGEAFVVKPSKEIFTNSATLIVLGASLCAGLAYTFVRALSVKGEKGPNIVLVFSAFSAVVCIPSFFTHPIQITLRQALLLLLMSGFACIGQITVTKAYSFAPSSEISIFDYTQVLFSALFGWVFYRQIASGTSYIGYVIIITAALLMYLYNKKKAGK